MHHEIQKWIFGPTKRCLGVFIFIYFWATMVTCDEQIPFCKDYLKALQENLKDWQKRCLNDKLYDIDTPCCKVEKEYIQRRRRTQLKLCFIKGK